MFDPWMLLKAWTAGAVLGTIFFGGLWWTIQRAVVSPRPALWFLVSLLLRTAIVLYGFFLLSSGTWMNLAVCLLGFVMARWFVTRVTRLPRAGLGGDLPEVKLAN